MFVNVHVIHVAYFSLLPGSLVSVRHHQYKQFQNVAEMEQNASRCEFSVQILSVDYITSTITISSFIGLQKFLL